MLVHGPLQELDLPSARPLPDAADEATVPLIGNEGTGSPPAVCGILFLKYYAAKSEEFHRWLSGIEAAAASFPGWLDHDVVESQPTPDGLVPVSVIIRYRSKEELQEWEMSPERAQWVAQAHEQKLTAYYSKMSFNSC